MYKISTLNKIAKIGLDRFSDLYEITDGADGTTGSTGILVRSLAMHDMEFDDMLLAIARAGAGVNNIPLDRCAEEGIVVFNTPGANANSVKELVIGSIIVASRNMADAILWTNNLVNDPDVDDVSKAVEKGKSTFAGHEISGKTLGVIGLGAIGALVANAALGLGMKVVGYDPYLTEAARERLLFDVEVVENLDDLLGKSDYITLHLPALDSTKGMISKDVLAKCKDGAVLLNFSRDTLVVEDDVLKALESKKLSRYVTDFATPGVLGVENVTVTPHLGASTEEAEDNCAIMAVDQMMDYIDNGNIKNSVNFPGLSLDSDANTRITILTKGEPHPDKLITAMFADKKPEAVAGAVRGDYGYAIFATNDEITEVPEVDEVIRVRIITRD